QGSAKSSCYAARRKLPTRGSEKRSKPTPTTYRRSSRWQICIGSRAKPKTRAVSTVTSSSVTRPICTRHTSASDWMLTRACRNVSDDARGASVGDRAVPTGAGVGGTTGVLGQLARRLIVREAFGRGEPAAVRHHLDRAAAGVALGGEVCFGHALDDLLRGDDSGRRRVAHLFCVAAGMRRVGFAARDGET